MRRNSLFLIVTLVVFLSPMAASAQSTLTWVDKYPRSIVKGRIDGAIIFTLAKGDTGFKVNPTMLCFPKGGGVMKKVTMSYDKLSGWWLATPTGLTSGVSYQVTVIATVTGANGDYDINAKEVAVTPQ